ncbi:MAG: exopolysaccharide biosynthesis polyprenyl glycosylphosphotransferase [Fusobacteriota bacterium]
MDYLKSKRLNAIYIFINIFFFFAIYTYIREPLNLYFYVMLSLSTIVYYVLNVFNLNESRYKEQMFISSAVINMALFIISLVFWEYRLGMLVYGAIFLEQNILKYFLLEFVTENRNIILIGKNAKAEILKEILKDDKRYNIADILSGNEKMEEIKDILEKWKIKKVILTKEKRDYSQEDLSEFLNLKLNGIELFDYLTFYEKLEEKVPVKAINEEWFLFERGFNILHDKFQKRVKRVVDIILTILISIPAIPVMIISAIIIKLESKGPIFFIQERIGQGNKPFKIIKFRSMREHNPEEYSKYAGEKDNRITRFGKFMRKTRIDELPQLINIIKGEMSFIGPRAEWDQLCYNYMEEIPFYNIRHSVKPGLTGWAQVKYPYGASIEDALEKLKYDLYYIKHQTFILDMIIFFKTFKTVFFGRGR